MYDKDKDRLRWYKKARKPVSRKPTEVFRSKRDYDRSKWKQETEELIEEELEKVNI